MSAPSTNERSATEPIKAVDSSDVQAIVNRLADEAANRDEFLQTLAAQIGGWLSAAIVAIQDTGWDQPRMLVTNPTLATGIDRDQLRELLGRAGASVASSPLNYHDASGIVMAGQPTSTCMGLNAELIAGPERCAIVVIQQDPTQQNPNPTSEWMPSMRLLGTCVQAVKQTQYGASKTPAQPPKDTDTRSLNELDRLASVRKSLRSFHQTLDPTATAYCIASELPRLLPCERAVVLLPTSRGRRRKYVVRAISGASVVDRRSPLVRTMNQLATKLAVMNKPMILPPPIDQDADELPPQIIEPLEDYLDESGVLSCVALPIAADAENESDAPPIAMLFLETFSGRPSPLITPAMKEIALEASTAITNATRYDDVFALPLRRPLAGISRAAIRNWTLALSLLLIGLAAASWFIRVEHTIVATGIARPIERRAVFASIDGTVDSIQARDGQRVSAGDVLVRLKNAEISREAQSLSGQLTTATAKLASLRSMQLAGSDDPTESAQNLIEQRTLTNEIETLGRRLEINQTMQDELILRAPIDGVVVGWRIDEKLRSRPVSRGDRLFAMIEPDGAWELDLKLNETKAGEVMRRHQAGETLPIHFAIPTRPTETMEATLNQVGGIARRQADGTTVVDVVASIDPDSMSGFQGDGFRGDADVTAKIVCGQRRLIDSWTDELFAWFHRNILFRF